MAPTSPVTLKWAQRGSNIIVITVIGPTAASVANVRFASNDNKTTTLFVEDTDSFVLYGSLDVNGIVASNATGNFEGFQRRFTCPILKKQQLHFNTPKTASSSRGMAVIDEDGDAESAGCGCDDHGHDDHHHHHQAVHTDGDSEEPWPRLLLAGGRNQRITVDWSSWRTDADDDAPNDMMFPPAFGQSGQSMFDMSEMLQ
jgi:hypothetical protein